MKKSPFSEEQIVGVLKEAKAGVSVKDLCCWIGMSDATLDHWKAKYGGLEVNETRRLRQVEEENGRLKKIVGAASPGSGRTEGGAGQKVPGPRAKREAVRVVREETDSAKRRACGQIGMHRGSWR